MNDYSDVSEVSSDLGGWQEVRMDKYLQYAKRQIVPEAMAGQDVFHYSIPMVQETGSGAIEDGSTVESNKLVVDRDLLLVSRLNPRKATICVASPSELLTVCSTEFVPLSPRGIDLKFVHYVTLSDPYRQRLESLTESATHSHQRVDPSDIFRFWWRIPSKETQNQVVSFLDRETATIDALIDKQEQLIATLREDRAATITQAVTKGLDPDAELRITDVEWISSLPTHWEIFKGTWIGTPFGSPAVAENDVGTEGDRAFLKVSSLSSSGLTARAAEWFVSSTYRAVSDFIAFPKRGAAIFTNKVNVIDFSAVIDPNLMGWKMLPGHDAHYYAFIIGSLSLEELADVSSVPQLNTKHIAELRLPRPPELEQQEIVAYLTRQCHKIDSLISESVNMIETLREYRSALITNAVTGKIDVREAV